MRTRTLWLAAQLILVAVGSTAGAESAFAPVPVAKGEKSALRMRVVHYDGSSNGELTVEVQNPGTESAKFSAHGLYFVPDGNANDAPQRLGAAGPFQARLDERWDRKDDLQIPPNATVRMKLDVYCIDSHRRSPHTGDVFHVAHERMPVDLVRAIDSDTTAAAHRAGGFAAPAAKSAIQSEVWKNRDKKWIKLDGEGVQERGK